MSEEIQENSRNKKLAPYRKADYLEFIRFMALPSFYRDDEYSFHKEGDFAKKYNLDPSTLTIWKKSSEFWDGVKVQLKEWGKGKTPDVILGLYRTAIRDGKAAEVRLWLEVFEDFKGVDNIINQTNIYQLANTINNKVDEETKQKIIGILEGDFEEVDEGTEDGIAVPAEE